MGSTTASIDTPHQPQQAPAQPADAQQQQQQPVDDPWSVNRPVERRSQALNEELGDCWGCFWSWVSCGGPAARVRQLYVQGRLSRCMDEYAKLKNCMLGKLDEDKRITVLPGPHPLWHIRTRKQAQQFWQEQYAHLGAQPGSSSSSGATDSSSSGGGGSGGSAAGQPDITSSGSRA